MLLEGLINGVYDVGILATPSILDNSHRDAYFSYAHESRCQTFR